jgi:hypothetical protein
MKAMNELRVQLSTKHTLSVINHQGQTIKPNIAEVYAKRMAIVAVCANSLLIRGSRDQQQPQRPLIPDRAALGDWQTWLER